MKDKAAQFSKPYYNWLNKFIYHDVNQSEIMLEARPVYSTQWVMFPLHTIYAEINLVKRKTRFPFKREDLHQLKGQSYLEI